MPLFDWIRTELSHELEDGSKVLYYDGASLLGLDPATFAQRFNAGSNGYSLPGWEPERLSTLESQLDQYRNIFLKPSYLKQSMRV
jgi:mannonate dehydratase